MLKGKKKNKIPPLSMIYRRIAISFVVLTVVLVGIIIFFSASKATIIITPQREIRSAEFLASVKANSPQGSISLNGIYEEKEVEEEAQFEATGVTEKQGRSEGVITVINKGNVSQPLVATTRFLSADNVLFRTTERITVPANGNIDVNVRADEPGSHGDIGPTSFSIPGLRLEKQKLIFGESKSAMAGGGMNVRVVTAEDIERARADAVESAENRVKEDFEKTPAATLGGVIVSSEVLSVESDAKAGDKKQTFTVVVKMKTKILAYDKEALEALALEKVSANVPSDREFASINKDSIIIRIKNANFETGEVQLSIYADVDAYLNASSPILEPIKIAGMLPNEAKQYLKSFEAIEDVEVALFPSWQKRIPTIPDRIKMVIKK